MDRCKPQAPRPTGHSVTERPHNVGDVPNHDQRARSSFNSPQQARCYDTHFIGTGRRRQAVPPHLTWPTQDDNARRAGHMLTLSSRTHRQMDGPRPKTSGLFGPWNRASRSGAMRFTDRPISMDAQTSAIAPPEQTGLQRFDAPINRPAVAVPSWAQEIPTTNVHEQDVRKKRAAANPIGKSGSPRSMVNLTEVSVTCGDPADVCAGQSSRASRTGRAAGPHR